MATHKNLKEFLQQNKNIMGIYQRYPSYSVPHKETGLHSCIETEEMFQKFDKIVKEYNDIIKDAKNFVKPSSNPKIEMINVFPFLTFSEDNNEAYYHYDHHNIVDWNTYHMLYANTMISTLLSPINNTKMLQQFAGYCSTTRVQNGISHTIISGLIDMPSEYISSYDKSKILKFNSWCIMPLMNLPKIVESKHWYIKIGKEPTKGDSFSKHFLILPKSGIQRHISEQWQLTELEIMDLNNLINYCRVNRIIDFDNGIFHINGKSLQHVYLLHIHFYQQ